MIGLALLAAAWVYGLAGSPTALGRGGPVFVTATVVHLPGGPSDAAAADGDAAFLGVGPSVVRLDLAARPPTARPAADVGADIAALAVDDARLWAGDVRGRLHVFRRQLDGTLGPAGSLDLTPDGGAARAVAKIVADGPRAFVTLAETGLVVVDAVDGALAVRGRVDRWDVAASIGVLDGAAYALLGGTLTRVDAAGGGELKRDAVSLAIGPHVEHQTPWEPQLLAVDAARRQLVAVGGVYGWAGRPCACAAFAFDLASPLRPQETAHGFPSYIVPTQLALGPDWAYLVSDDHSALEQAPRWTLTALGRGRERLNPQVWWQGTEAIGAPAPLPDGGVVLPMHAGGFILLAPHVAGRVWLPFGRR